jgi:[ribosomal protein S5]-alanine N-acetyltransferase
MRAMISPLMTPRLRLEPVTPAMAAAAREGPGALARLIEADVPAQWGQASLALIGRSAETGFSPAPPIRAVAVLAEEGCVVGDVRFEPAAPGEEVVEIGYSVAPAWRRLGLAVEAAGAVIDWHFEAGGAERAVAGCDRRNLGSVRTLRKLGFWLDGSMGQAFWWVLTPELRAAARA